MDLERELTEQRNARFKALLEPIHEGLQRWALQQVKNQADAEDVLSKAIIAGLQSIHQLKNDGAFKTWMFRIVSNVWRMELRARKRPMDVVDPADLANTSAGGGLDNERSESARLVRAALAKLSPEQSNALWLFEVEGLSTREVAAVLGKQEVATRVLLHRARERLRELLKAAGIQG